MSDLAKPGALLKSLRLEKRLTLSELAGRTGIPVSTISKVENDKLSLNYDKLQSLSAALGIDAGVFFKKSDPIPPDLMRGRRSIAKIGDGKQIETHLTSYLHLASELRGKHFIPLIAEIRARSMSAFGELVQHQGEEFTYVLEGALEVHSLAYAPVQLVAGESIYFDSGMPHAYLATSKGVCRVLMICSSSEAQLYDGVDRSRPKRLEDEARAALKPKAARKTASKPTRSKVHRKSTRGADTGNT